MAKRKSIIIFGTALLAAVVALGAVLALIGTGVVGASAQPLVFTSASAEAEYSGVALTDDRFAITSGSIKEGHTAYADMSGSQTDAGTSENSFTVTIFDERGNDVTGDYQFECVPGTLTVLPRKLEMKSGDGTKIYDGAPLTIETYTVIAGSLAGDDEIVASFTGAITAWGTADNVFSARIIDGMSRDVTRNYNLIYDYGKLTVDKRAITIATESAQKQYDGKPLTESGYSVSEGTLVKDHELSVTTTGAVVNAGVGSNTFDAVITDGSGVDVTENYEITPIRGTLTVTKRAVTVSSGSATKAYDGAPLTEEYCYISSGELVTGHNYRVSTSASIVNVGTAPNTVDLYITDALGEDVSGNYETIQNAGTLEITPAVITVETASAAKTYDGAPLTDGRWRVVTDGFSTEFVAATDSVLLYGDDRLTLDVYGAQTVAGSSANNCAMKSVINGSVDASKNYTLRTIPGTLTVTKRAVTVRSKSASKIYDGEPLTQNGYEITSGSVLNGHKLVASSSASITEAGAVTVVHAVTIKCPLSDVGENTESSDNADGTDSVEYTDVSDNYDITVIPGTLTVTKRVITIVPASATKVYDGTPLTAAGYTVADGTLLEKHRIFASAAVSLTDAGTAANVLNVAVKRLASPDEDTEDEYIDVSGNYEIVQSAGTLEVLPLEVVIETRPASKVYDGEPLTAGYWRPAATTNYVPSGGYATLAGGGRISVRVFGTQTLAGSSDNNCVVLSVTKTDGTDASGNYAVRLHLGLLTVTRRPLAIRSGSVSKLYDGEPLTCDEWEIVSETTLADGETASVAISGVRVDIGESPNTIAEVRIMRGTTDVTANYDILRDLGYLLVTGRSGASLGDPGSGLPPDTVILKLYSETTESNIYLRSGSYGDYAGNGFYEAPEYGGLLDGTYSYGYLPAFLLRDIYDSSSLTVELILSSFVLPYYPEPDDATLQTSDVAYYSALNYYSVAYYKYDYASDNGAHINAGSKYAAEEAAYARFVRDNYLAVPDSTRAFLERFIAENGIDISSATLIADVAGVIQNSAEYNLDYDTALDDENDAVVAFLDKYKEGVCRHYAASAVMLYRTLGIPARYTTGVLGETEAGKWTNITAAQAHAWAEVYIDGVGWVMVEVTGGRSDGSGDKNDNTIKPVDCSKRYDGTPLYAQNAAQGLADYIAKGYTYVSTVTGSQTEIGYGVCSFDTFTLYDPNGEVAIRKNGDAVVYYDDNTRKLRFSDGVLHVYKFEITVETGSASKTYDGETLSCEEFTVTDGRELQQGHTLAVGSFTVHNGVGAVNNLISVKILDGADDVSYLYHVVYDYGKLEITPLVITVRAGSAEALKSELEGYGGALTCADYTLVFDGAEYDYSGSAVRSIDFIASGHSIAVYTSGSCGKVGRADNVVSAVEIYDGSGNNVAPYFIILTEEGRLTVRNG